MKSTVKCKGAKCKISSSFLIPVVFRVVDTDYETYSVVYSCIPYPFFKDEIMWILTRARIPDSSIITTAENIIKAKLPNYSLDNFKKIQQGGTCRYLYDEYVAPI